MSSPVSGPSAAQSPPSLVDLTAQSAADLLLPWVVSLISDGEPTAAGLGADREVVVYVHQPTRSLFVVEGSADVDTLLSDVIDSSKEGPLPASKSSIDSLPRVSLSPEKGFECPICLAENEGGDKVEVKEMPCRHRFHAECVDKWLGLRRTCPICRFGIPAAEEKKVEGWTGWRVHVNFARGGGYGEGRRNTEGGAPSDEEMPAEGTGTGI